tara:strand:- start:1817 stop:2188 length:372 start_codon:yes stop_codon:yes gene_type:complete
MEIVNWKRGLDEMLSCKLKHNSAVHFLAIWDNFNFHFEATVDSILLPSIALIVLYWINRRDEKKRVSIPTSFFFYLILYFSIIHVFDRLGWFVADGIYMLIFEVIVVAVFILLQQIILILRKK